MKKFTLTIFALLTFINTSSARVRNLYHVQLDENLENAISTEKEDVNVNSLREIYSNVEGRIGYKVEDLPDGQTVESVIEVNQDSINIIGRFLLPEGHLLTYPYIYKGEDTLDRERVRVNADIENQEIIGAFQVEAGSNTLNFRVGANMAGSNFVERMNIPESGEYILAQDKDCQFTAPAHSGLTKEQSIFLAAFSINLENPARYSAVIDKYLREVDLQAPSVYARLNQRAAGCSMCKQTYDCVYSCQENMGYKTLRNDFCYKFSGSANLNLTNSTELKRAFEEDITSNDSVASTTCKPIPEGSYIRKHWAGSYKNQIINEQTCIEKARETSGGYVWHINRISGIGACESEIEEIYSDRLTEAQKAKIAADYMICFETPCTDGASNLETLIENGYCL